LKNSLLTKESVYKAGLVKRVWIPKKDPNKLRPLGIPIVLDRALQALVVMALDPVIEQESDIHSYGSRRYRGT
jgi:RNA-directed DNA polymerase